MAIKKTSKLTAKPRKKSSTLATNRSKTAAAKATAKSRAAKKKRREELNQLASRMFQMVYKDYQQGKFHRIL
jgi:hypothetical protein